MVQKEAFEQVLVAVAHALYMNRLHLLRLTEIVRLGIKPDPVDNNMELPTQLDEELKQQAIDYVLTCMPQEYGVLINQAKSDWLRPA